METDINVYIYIYIYIFIYIYIKRDTFELHVFQWGHSANKNLSAPDELQESWKFLEVSDSKLIWKYITFKYLEKDEWDRLKGAFSSLVYWYKMYGTTKIWINFKTLR